MIRVLVAEDSATVRELLVEILEADGSIEVVGLASNGMEAVEMATGLRPDVITMDINMPLVDGFEATKEIMIEAPTRILIVSSSSAGNIEMALNATRAGALMVLPTPTSPHSERFDEERAELVRAVRSMAGVKVVRRWRSGASTRPVPPSRRQGARGRIVAIAASTGGPAALQRVLMDLPGEFPVPILVVQHIAHGFTEGLCTWLRGSCNLRVNLARHGQTLQPHTVYLAPDDRHLGVDADGRSLLSAAAPIGGFRPSANFLFSSVARAYADAAIGVVLTGMGRDGLDGAGRLHAAGGSLIAQDEETSIVYGMPKEVIAAGFASSVLPVHAIPHRLIELISRNADAM